MSWRRWFVGGLGLAALAIYTTRYPLVPVATIGFTRPESTKIVAALRSLSLLLLVNGAAFGCGGPLWSRLRPRGRPDDLAAPVRLGLGLMVLSTAVLTLAALHLLERPVLLGLLVALAAVPARSLLLTARESGRRWRRALPLPMVALGAAGGLAGFLCAFVPYYGWDGLTYHLALPERYLFWNRIWVTPFSLFTVFPLGVEMLYTLALGVDGPALAKLLNLQFGLLTLMAAYRLAGRRSPRAGLLAMALLLGDPLFGWELTVAYTDLAVACYGLLAAAALADWRASGEPPLLCRAGLLAGACASVKYPGAAIPVAFGVWLLWAGGGSFRRRCSAVVVLGLTSLLPLVPWCARNWVFTGNPVAPMFQSVFNGAGHEFLMPRVLDQIFTFNHATGMGHDPWALLMLPWNLSMRSVPGVYGNSFGFQVGALWGVVPIAALLVADVRRDPLVRVLLPVSGLLTLFWFLGVQDARLLLPAFALLAIVGAAAFDAVSGGAGWNRLLLVLPVSAAAYGLWHGAQNVGWYYGYGLGVLDRDALEARDPVEQAARALRRTCTSDDRVLLLFESRGWFFRGLDYVPAVVNEGSEVLQIVHRAADVHDLRCRLESMGVTHVVLNENNVRKFPPTPVEGYDDADIVRDVGRARALLAEWTTPLFGEDGVVAARLRPVTDCEP